MRVEEFSTTEEFKSLEPIWNTTLNNSSHPTLYLTYEWLSVWWKCHQTPEKRLYILVIRDDETVFAIAPFMIITRTIFGIPVRTISFLSMMRYAYSALNCSGSLDIIVTQRHDEVFQVLFAHLNANAKRWDYMRLHPVPENSYTLKALQQAATSQGFPFSTRLVFASACITAATWEEYTKALSQTFRKGNRNMLNRLARSGAVEFIHVDGSTDTGDALQKLLSIEKRSWKRGNGIAIDAPQYKNFYKEIFHIAGNHGWLHLWMLKVNETYIAYDLCLVFNGSVEVLKGSYNTSFREYSPGRIIFSKELEYFFQNGIRKINLLWGDLTYKLRWANHLERHHEIYLFNNTLFSKCLHAAYITTGLYRVIRLAWNSTEKLCWRLGVQV